MGARWRAGGAVRAARRAAPFFRAALFCAPPSPWRVAAATCPTDKGSPCAAAAVPRGPRHRESGGRPAAAAAVVSDPSARRKGRATGRRGRGVKRGARGGGRMGPHAFECRAVVAVFLAVVLAWACRRSSTPAARGRRSGCAQGCREGARGARQGSGEARRGALDAGAPAQGRPGASWTVPNGHGTPSQP